MSANTILGLSEFISPELVPKFFEGNAEWARQMFLSLFIMYQSSLEAMTKQKPLDSNTWPQLLLPVIPLSVLAYLVRKPNTVTLRLLLFPFAFITTFRGAFIYFLPGSRYAGYNYLKCVIYIVVLGKTLDYTFYGAGIFKPKPIFSSVALGAQEEDTAVTPKNVTDARSRSCSTANGIRPKIERENGKPNETFEKEDRKFFDYLKFLLISPRGPVFELLLSLRGLNLDYGRAVFIPPETRPIERGPFILATIRKLVITFFLLDLIDTSWKTSAPFCRQPGGGSIFDEALTWYTRYTLSTIYHVSTGLFIINTFEFIYGICTLIGVGLLNQPPATWPPIFFNPFASQCLQEFWAVRWHQMFRRTFFVFGGILGHWIGRRLGRRDIGLLFGTFLASGLYHELPLFALRGGWDGRMLLFFVAQAFFVIFEKLWKEFTGRPVSGIGGKMWCLLTVVVFGQSTCQYSRRGSFKLHTRKRAGLFRPRSAAAQSNPESDLPLASLDYEQASGVKLVHGGFMVH